jgi:PAS domain S-box-containing protein
MNIDSPKGAPDTGVLEIILKETQARIGQDYFRAISRNLAESLDCWGCWVTEYFPESRHMVALAFWAEGGYIEHYEYDVDGTVCAPAVDEARLYHVGDNLIDMFPESDLIVSKRAVSYIGSPILDTRGKVIGLVGVMDTKPLTDKVKISIFELFVERATAELNRLRMQNEIEVREEQFRLLVHSALDGILLLDRNLEIVRANESAARIFGGDREAMTGESLLRLLTESTRDRIGALAATLRKDPSTRKSLFLQDDLCAHRFDRSEFRFEGSISLFPIRETPHFCLIIRDLNDAIESAERIRALTRETQALRESVRDLAGEIRIIGDCTPMRNLVSHIDRVARTHSSVLIRGETGSGKELVARAIHEKSSRCHHQLVCVNCAALPENLIESELFGHAKGAFTGAEADRNGRFSQADGGTLFLDEIGELPLGAQAKLLRVLQAGEFERLGSSQTFSADVRVIAATHRNLTEMVESGSFREDLFFRLNVFPLNVPPLRERGEDIIQLANATLAKLSKRMGRRIEPLDSDSTELLMRYDWPGNVRQLQNTLERALILSDGDRLDLAKVMPVSTRTRSKSTGAQIPSNDTVFTVEELRAMEKANIERALRASDGRVSGEQGAAQLLGLKPTTLTSRIKKFGLSA